METFLTLIQKYKKGESAALNELINRMTPLAKKYAAMMHFQEYEDSLQEMYLALVKAFKSINPEKSERECLKYIEGSVINHYFTLCQKKLSLPKTEPLPDHLPEKETTIDESLIDVEAFIHSFSKDSIQYKILCLYFYQEKSDREIAEELHFSRQYINRIRKKIINEYLLSR